MKQAFLFRLCPCLILLLLPLLTKASHIIGGDMAYECLETGKYRITLNMYVNCDGTANEYFPTVAPISIYKGNMAPYQFIETFSIPFSDPTRVSLADDPCMAMPPDVCIEEGKYIFETFLPISSESYHVVFQRCCRNTSISNLIVPNQVGATYALEILPAAQQLCNSSPTFSTYPSPVICANQNIKVDHMATDPDGDQLGYSFCEPLAGAGLEGTTNGSGGDPAACDGFRPDPACPPPYFSVPFILPDFSAQAPIPGDPQISVHSETGELTGVPNLQGTFAVGLCVSEYRDGELLSVLRRDIQLTVADCHSVLPSLAQSRYEGDTLAIYTCGELNWRFKILNLLEGVVGDFLWEIDVDNNGQYVSSTEWEPSYTFPSEGIYTGRLHIYGGLPCEKTILLSINTKAEDCLTSGTTENQEIADFTLFPNPADHSLHLTSEGNIKMPTLNFQILDARGAVLVEGEKVFNAEKLLTWNTERWPVGTYFLRYQDGEDNFRTKRFVIWR